MTASEWVNCASKKLKDYAWAVTFYTAIIATIGLIATLVQNSRVQNRWASEDAKSVVASLRAEEPLASICIQSHLAKRITLKSIEAVDSPDGLIARAKVSAKGPYEPGPFARAVELDETIPAATVPNGTGACVPFYFKGTALNVVEIRLTSPDDGQFEERRTIRK